MSKKEVRIKRELDKMMKQPPAGISLCMINDNISELRASIMGVAGTPYESGVFKLDVNLPDRYPYEPPHVRFKTPVYHPNIDDNGRICLELLKQQPSGCWRPVVTIEAVLLSIQSLLGAPNPDDPLMANIASQYRLDKQEFERIAREHTLKHACQNKPNIGNSSKCDDNSLDSSKQPDANSSSNAAKRKSSDGGLNEESSKKVKTDPKY
ncbi:ubiquitin-conjugating enzyme E2 D4-like [Frankliniella occidentalis]|uniref:Ubiquitin-conjugating enzyme E2 T n=1 Tax=Frankliniella occidentalis TaxID=133901 RepID=A0A9C6WWG6_FRAOC|nr:ubiquitin-conjugating enzyme E2 D4-like [Frankliniella occidentalis]